MIQVLQNETYQSGEHYYGSEVCSATYGTLYITFKFVREEYGIIPICVYSCCDITANVNEPRILSLMANAIHYPFLITSRRLLLMESCQMD